MPPLATSCIAKDSRLNNVYAPDCNVYAPKETNHRQEDTPGLQIPRRRVSIQDERVSKVDFVRKIKIRRIPLRETLSMKQQNALYYSKEEYKAIRVELFRQLRHITANTVDESSFISDDEDVCIRGLENETPSGKEKRRQNKLLARRKVLDEYRFQQRNNVTDDQYISYVYTMHARRAVEDAIEMGKRDAMEAERLYTEDPQW
jgi:hypothetical protein